MGPQVDTTTQDGREKTRSTSIRRQRLRLALAWGLLAVLLLALISVVSGGFFLYAALVVGGLLFLSTTLVSLSILELRFERHLDTSEVAVGGVVQATLHLHNAKHWPAMWLLWRDPVEPGLDMEGAGCSYESLRDQGRGRLDYRLHTTRRGLFKVGPAVAEASGPFGLVKRFRVDRGADFITVLPRSIPLGQGWPLGHQPIHQIPRRRSLFEDPSRFLGVREYRPGDSLRRIHWRATARSGELQVKLFEPAVLDGLLLAVEMSSTIWQHHGTPSVDADGGTLSEDYHHELGNLRQELAVTAALSMADWVLAAGQSVGLLSNGADAAERYGDTWTGGTFRQWEEALETSSGRRKLTGHRPLEVPAARGHWQADRLRVALARLSEVPGKPLGDLLLAELPRLPRSHVLMIVTPQLDPTLVAALETVRRAGLEVAVVWVTAPRRRREGGPPIAAPMGIPVYRVAEEHDLERLASTRL